MFFQEHRQRVLHVPDAQMSGTAFGTIVLQVSHEAAVGGMLALLQTGDRIRLSVRDRKMELLVDGAELEHRRAAWSSTFVAAQNIAAMAVSMPLKSRRPTRAANSRC
ncbi:MAG: dihydroxy-acid dehydratase [Rhodobacteraceae bacterium]|nr:dihydroxy-acid dehydratase [Paracoccaceae bacterium]